MFSKELEELIDNVLADGEITEKERQALYARAARENISQVEIDVIVDGRLDKIRNHRRNNSAVNRFKDELKALREKEREDIKQIDAEHMEMMKQYNADLSKETFGRLFGRKAQRADMEELRLKRIRETKSHASESRIEMLRTFTFSGDAFEQLQELFSFAMDQAVAFCPLLKKSSDKEEDDEDFVDENKVWVSFISSIYTTAMKAATTEQQKFIITFQAVNFADSISDSYKSILMEKIDKKYILKKSAGMATLCAVGGIVLGIILGAAAGSAVLFFLPLLLGIGGAVYFNMQSSKRFKEMRKMAGLD